MAAFYQRVVQALVAAAYPQRCLVCGMLRRSATAFDDAGPLERIATRRPFSKRMDTSAPDPAVVQTPDSEAWRFENLMRPYVCRACRATYTPIRPPLCRRCGMLFKSRSGTSHLCGACLNKPGHFTMARAVGVYEQVLMEVVHHFKYRGKIQLARPLGRCLFAEFMRHWGLQAVDVIVPVPLHLKRFRRRGFNQAYLLVKEWRQLASALGNGQAAFKIDPQILERHRRTAPQSGLGRKQRQANLRKAVTVAKAERVQGKHALVVDDVYTTGATAEECARTLLSRGAERVDILTLARVL